MASRRDYKLRDMRMVFSLLRRHPRILLLLCLLLSVFALSAAESAANLATLIKKERIVEFAAPAADWMNAPTNQRVRLRDRLRTREFSRAALLLADLDVLQVDELTILEVLPAEAATSKARLNLKQGAFYFFHRSEPQDLEIETPFAVAGVVGTEFHVSVAANGQTIFTVFDGKLNIAAQLEVTNNQQALVAPGQPPRLIAMVPAENILQWCLYYPGVASIPDLALSPAETNALADVLDSYRRGHLLQALDRFAAAAPPPDSPALRSLRAALALCIGRVAETQAQLDSLPAETPVARALRTVIGAVKHQSLGPLPEPATASEALAQSYYFQSFSEDPNSLNRALAAAIRATELDTNFGFAWVRRAELEFSFGRVPESLRALERGLELSPDNAQGHALRGFVSSADNRVSEALGMFEHALENDSALANAWLGRGLCKLRLGQRNAGRADLEIAAALEPNRSVLRSYLGKAFTEIHRDDLAEHELDLARTLDKNDPTPWLYSALLSRQLNLINAAVAELERSAALNDNRRLYRSRLLLDQDQAVRSASLANIYRGAGLGAASVREASQAVNSDYANPSAHLFLAESFDALRDPKRINLRYETTWFNERLLANMLAPVGGGNLSQHITEQEYSRFFTRDAPGLSGLTEYSSIGDWRMLGSQYGTWRNTAWALDVEYHKYDGSVPNSGFDRIEWYTQVKEQLTTDDSIFILTKYQDFTAGDDLQYFDPKSARRQYHFSEQQQPILLAGYQHEWQQGIRTLFLGGRLENDLSYTDAGHDGLIVSHNPTNHSVIDVTDANPFYDISYRNRTENYTAELNQIFESDRHLLVIGGRFNAGHFETHNEIGNLESYSQSGLASIFRAPSARDITTDIERESAYGYYTWKAGPLLATAGVAYDYLRYPENFRDVPISTRQASADQVSPKAAIVWTPNPDLRLRAAWTRSLGGVTFDESIRLEPTQLAGFVQSYRTLISETVAGSVSAPRFESAGAGAEWKPRTGTYLGAQLDWLWQEVDRQKGVFNLQTVGSNQSQVELVPGQTPESLRYEEPSVTAYVNQLLGDSWALGASYRFTHSSLDDQFNVFPITNSVAISHQRADYHELLLQVRWNHPSGWFWRAEAQWRQQEYSAENPFGADGPTHTSEDFWQCNAFVGYRLRHQRGEITLGVLNIFNEDYRLQPLSPHLDLPRERAFYTSARFNF